MTLDFSRCRLQPFQHQQEDVAWLMDRPYAFITSEMRTGKSKIVVDAAQFLYATGKINRVIVIAPAPVRDVWADRRLGELAKHLWDDMPATITEYHSRIRTWHHGPVGETFDWYVTNFEFMRSQSRLKQLLGVCGPRTLLVLDESSFVKNYAAQQTKSCLILRRACGRVILLNGTPIFHSPMDLFSQGNILHPSILQCPYVTQFKSRYAVQEVILTHGGKPLQKVVTGRNGKKIEVSIQKISGWRNLEDLQRRFAPVTVRRLQADCLDLPPKLDPVMLTATLTPETWRTYRQMRDELVVWLNESTVATSATAAVKALRLSQITSGFLSGVEEAKIDPWFEDPSNMGVAWSDPKGESIVADVQSLIETMENDKQDYTLEDIAEAQATAEPNATAADKLVKDVGREKLEVLLWFIEQRLEADPNLHIVVWCRFRAEAFRTIAEVAQRFPQFETGLILGGQKRTERLRTLALLKPETSPTGPVCVVGIEGTGSFGLDMTAAHTCVTLSSGYSPGRTAQTLDRVYGPAQKHPIAYFSILATGPKGQHTIDHTIEEARRMGQDVATWTAAHWVKMLMEEE